jgi:hypothetical protein
VSFDKSSSPDSYRDAFVLIFLLLFLSRKKVKKGFLKKSANPDSDRDDMIISFQYRPGLDPIIENSVRFIELNNKISIA